MAAGAAPNLKRQFSQLKMLFGPSVRRWTAATRSLAKLLKSTFGLSGVLPARERNVDGALVKSAFASRAVGIIDVASAPARCRLFLLAAWI